MIDLHSHLIWDIDDGSESKKMTINMLKQAVKGNTTKLILTPHYLKGFYEPNIIYVKKRCEEIENLVKEEGLPLQIYYGQEVYLTEDILSLYKDGFIGTINESRYMLIEMNMKKINVRKSLKIISNLIRYNIVPVIVHPERYILFVKNPKIINKFIKLGCLFQLNVGSLSGDFGKKAKKLGKFFIENKIYSFIGSDAHKDFKRNPNMSKGINIINSIDSNYLEYIEKSSKNLLENREIKFIGRNIRNIKLINYFLIK